MERRQRQGKLHIRDSKCFAAYCNWRTQNETRPLPSLFTAATPFPELPLFLSQHPSSPVWGEGWISSVLLSTSSVVSYIILTSFTDITFSLGSHETQCCQSRYLQCHTRGTTTSVTVSVLGLWRPGAALSRSRAELAGTCRTGVPRATCEAATHQGHVLGGVRQDRLQMYFHAIQGAQSFVVWTLVRTNIVL